MYVQTEILFPPRLIPQLRDACGPELRKLVERISALEDSHPESLAFTLMMIRLDGCLECETDSFRAMRGCLACALQNLRRHRANERELLKLYKAALQEVREHLAARPASAPPAPRAARSSKTARAAPA
jgi:hypothetical protein